MVQDQSRNCPVVRALDVVGDRWTILILRDLLLHGARKFHELQRTLVGISPNTLSARLKHLEDNGVVTREFYEQHPPRAQYLLTPRGRELGPMLKMLLEWGKKHTTP
jgi:DNA-binding HxlR family transcriptional regulator